MTAGELATCHVCASGERSAHEGGPARPAFIARDARGRGARRGGWSARRVWPAEGSSSGAAWCVDSVGYLYSPGRGFRFEYGLSNWTTASCEASTRWSAQRL